MHMSGGSVARRWAIAVLALSCGAVGATTGGSVLAAMQRPAAAEATEAAALTAAEGTTLPGTKCPAFPADNVWNTPITHLPVDSHSAEWLRAMDSGSTYLHPDFGPSGTRVLYGIPWQIVKPAQPLVKISFMYASESDKGPYPFSASTPIEGGPKASGDRHAIMVNPKTCTLYELWLAYYHAHDRSTAGSGAIWSLLSNKLRPATWTSADAAGLPILPGLVNYDEVKSGAMDHAIRFTADCTHDSFLWPARHEAGVSDSSCPPMGARFRLDAGFHLSKHVCDAMCQTVLTTMKTYGLILADNGSNWFFQGTADSRWTYTDVDELKQIPARDFVAVNESCLQVSANSGEAYQPGTAAYTKHCG